MPRISEPEDFRLPVFFCPIPSVVHPDIEKLEATSLAWCDSHGLGRIPQVRRTLVATKAFQFVGGYTHDTDFESQTWFTNFNYWLWAFDNGYCDDGPTSTRAADFTRYAAALSRLLDTPYPHRHPADDPILSGFGAVNDWLETHSTAAQFTRWRHAVLRYLWGNAQQVANIEQGHWPDLDTYFAIRMDTSGMRPGFAAAEIALGTELSPGEIYDDRVQVIGDFADLIASIDNDIYGLPMELTTMTNQQTTVTIIARQDDCTLEEAIGRAVILRDRMMHRLVELSNQVLHTANPPLARYVRALLNSVRSNIDWGTTAPRYADHHTSQGCVTDTTTTQPDPLVEYPTIAWWWKL